MWQDFKEEHALQAFSRVDKAQTGHVSALQFQEIMTELKPHLLTKFVKDNLLAVAGGGRHAQQVSYPYFIAFISLLKNMELIRKIFVTATKGNLTRDVTKGNMIKFQRFACLVVI
jgi:solute carrier family 25 aspartate/glutamate transporter 12/13